MPARTPSPARLGLLWFGIQAVWGGVLAISLQARSSQLGGAHALATYGAIATGGAIVAGMTQLAIGPLADRRRARGSRRTEFYFAGVGVAVVALAAFYTAATFAQLIGAFVLLQFGMNVAIGPYQSVIPDYIAPQRTGTASSWMAALQSLGNAAGAILASSVADLRVVAAGLGAILVATAIGTSAHVRRLPLRTVAAARMKITRTFMDLFLSRALIYVGFYTLLGYLYFYVASLGGIVGDAAAATGPLLVIFLMAGTVGAAFGARPADRFDRRAVVTAAGAGFIAGLCTFVIGHDALALYAAVTIAGAAWGVFLSADWALGCALLPREALATAFGIWNLALIGPQIVAPALTSAVLIAFHALESSGAPRVAFALAAIEVAAGIAWIWRLPATNVRV